MTLVVNAPLLFATHSDGFTKIFQLPLSEKMEKSMAMLKQKIGNVLEFDLQDYVAAEEQRMAALLEVPFLSSFFSSIEVLPL